MHSLFQSSLQTILLTMAFVIATPEARVAVSPAVRGVTIKGLSQALIIRPHRTHLLRFDDRRSLTVLSDKRVVILDKESTAIDVYGSTSEYLYSLPIRVEGRRTIPPKAFAVSASNVVATIEMTGQAITLYRLGKTRATLSRTVQIPGVPTAICAMEKSFLIHLNESDRTIYVLSDDGELKSGFQMPIADGVPPSAKIYFNLELVCVPERDLVLAYSPAFPELLAYSAVGKFLWKQELSSFVPLKMTRRSDGGLEVSVGGARSDEVVSAFALDSTVAVVQARTIRHIGDAENPKNRPTSHLIDMRNGAEIGRNETLPLFSFATPSTLFSYDSESGSIVGFNYTLAYDSN